MDQQNCRRSSFACRAAFFVATIMALVANSVAASSSDAIDREHAVRIALENAGVPRHDVMNLKAQREEEGSLPVYSVEFETEYGDFDFCISRRDGSVVDADCEVDEEWIRRQHAVENSEKIVRDEVLRRVPRAKAADIRLKKEGHRYEGVLWHDGLKYEFEADTRTGIISDWNADMRR